MGKKFTRKYFDKLLLQVFGEFEEQFFIGIATGFMALSIILYRSFGLGFAMMASGQMHLISLDVIFLLIPIFYHLLVFEPNNGKRVLASICFSVFVFSLHDVAWLLETHFVPPLFKVPIADLDLAQYIYHYCKNAMNIIIAMAFIAPYLELSEHFLVLFSFQCGFHLLNVLYKVDIYILNPYALIIMYFFDTIPYFFILKKSV